MVGIQDYRCILITGATSGIGRGLARSISRLNSKPTVVAIGRRDERLQELKQEGLETMKMEIDTDENGIDSSVSLALSKYPEIDCIIMCAGIQKEFDLKNSSSDIFQEVRTEMNINYISPVTMILKFIPHFLKLTKNGNPCSVIAVTSGLAIVPAAWCPNYSASKAAMHSFMESLRVQMKGTNIKVTEILPPLVESELHDRTGTTEKLTKFWVPHDKFNDAVMEGLKAGHDIICYNNEGSQGTFDRFEKGKSDISQRSYDWFSTNIKN